MASSSSTITERNAIRERKPSTSAPITELQGPVGPDFTRPKHKRTVTGFGPGEIKAVEAAIPEGQRAAWRKYVSAPTATV
jgi:starch phosphorylase